MNRLLPVSDHDTAGGQRRPPRRGCRPVGSIPRDQVARRIDGFTLLEVLLAAGLSAVMLGALWALLSMQVRLFAEDPVQVTRAQLVRSLVQLLSEDLQSALPAASAASGETAWNVADGTEVAATSSEDGSPGQTPATTTGPPDGGSSTRRLPSTATAGTVVDSTTTRNGGLGLVGTPDSLQFDVLRPVPALVLAAERADGALPRTGQGHQQVMSRVPEIFRVAYRFEPPRAIRGSALPVPTGLIRQAWHWEMGEPDGFANGMLDAPPPVGLGASETSDGDGSAAKDDFGYGHEPTDGSWETDVVPEVVELEFRYFDGDRWSDWWDSQSMGGLPQAVELRMRVAMEGTDEQPTATGEALETDRRQEPEDLADDATAPDGFFRMVVYLPAARKPDLPPRAGLSSGTGNGGVLSPGEPEGER